MSRKTPDKEERILILMERIMDVQEYYEEVHKEKNKDKDKKVGFYRHPVLGALENLSMACAWITRRWDFETKEFSTTKNQGVLE